jgi:hypothetical protein
MSRNTIPLSHFALDYPQPPEGWALFLGRHAIKFAPDDLGRDCIRRGDAKRLLDERRAHQLRVAAGARVAEAEAVEADAVDVPRCRMVCQRWTFPRV